ncbi:hypothetical protein L1987_18680 [Smallanthus sonchifolius]|uniref:Uncharacterized protein n=1 Tax=Smallanthus sonchifolius TaxID=185202 RepID=A0ACB9J101_9ASTR|nr:hypothetical protein L1987_18680 [Smallanthus sonchifolius]
MPSANLEPAPLQPVVSDDEDIQEEPDQVSELEPEEKSEEGSVGDADSDTDSGETVPSQSPMGRTLEVRRTARKTVLLLKKRALSSTNDEPLPKRHCLTSQQEIGESTHPSEDTSEDSDAIMEALDDRLVQLHGEVGLHDLAVGRLHR